VHDISVSAPHATICGSDDSHRYANVCRDYSFPALVYLLVYYPIIGFLKQKGNRLRLRAARKDD
jgi:hypothetical protein